jgi:Periplasmic component of the Tol biopolymer transport system
MKMFAVRCFGYSIAFAVTFSSTLFAQSTQLLSVPGASQPIADSGSGDSVTPIISADGRYVLFASTANNLVVTGTNNPIPAVAPAPLHVYLRDRTSGTTTLVSVNSSGAGGGNDNSWPVAISTNGQYVLFESAASNLVSGDTNKSTDVFVRDLVNTQTFLVSVNTNGLAANRDSSGSAMTPDGRYVAFISRGTDLMPNDTNGISDVFVRDLQSSNTVLVSVGAVSASASAWPSIISPEISSDGRYVLFTSIGTNLVPGVLTTNELYLRDLVAGTTAWASSAATQAVWNVFAKTNAASFNYILSRDGRFVSYQAAPLTANGTTGIILRYDAVTSLTDIINTNALALPLGNNRSLDATPDGRFVAFLASTNGPPGTNSSVYVWDAQNGAITLASADLNGQVPSNSVCAWPVLDSTGQYIAFLSAGSGLVSNTVSSDFHLYRRDLLAGSTVLLDSNTNNSGSLLNTMPVPSLSADGQLVAFESVDAKFVPRDANRSLDVFVRNIGGNSTELVSVRDAVLPSNSPNGPNTLPAFSFSVSSDGRFVAFATDAENVIPNDTNGCRDVVVRDLLLGTNLLVSANTNDLPANNFSTGPAISFSSGSMISGDGRFVAFTSAATDLVPGDSNKSLDVFVRDMQTGLTTLISVKTNGSGPGNKDSYSPVISTDGRFVLFHSVATDLAPGVSGGDNLFLRDRQLGTTTALTTSGVFLSTTMSPDGHYIAFNASLGTTAALYVWDSQSSRRIYTNVNIGVALSPDGRKLIYSSSGSLYVADPVANSSGALLLATDYRVPFHFSADSRYVVTSLINGSGGINQIYLFDLQAGTNMLISQSHNSSSPANAKSDSPDISADGRFIAYRSAATDLLPSDTVGVPDIFLYDRQTGLTTLLTQSRFGNYNADNRSRSPVFSGDGKILFFESSASDLVDQTFNFNPNIFAYGTYVMPPFPVAVALDTQGPLLSWLKVPGKTYQVQFKTAFNDPWQDLSGEISIVGNTEYFRDISPSSVLRFYRVKAF